MLVCTVVARHSAVCARVLARSLTRFEPNGSCSALVVDDPSEELDASAEPFGIVRPSQLRIDPWERLTAGYEEDELGRAVLPWLVRHLLSRDGVTSVLYVAPGSEFVGPPADVESLLADHPVVVDAISPALTLAAFAATDDIRAMLDRWIARLEAHCLVAPERGYLDDQWWLDVVSEPYTLPDPQRYVRTAGVDAVDAADESPRYAWGELPDGTPLDAAARRAYRGGVAARKLSDENVFTAAGAATFTAYLRSPGRHTGLTVYLESLHAGRRDLQERFPALDGADAARLAAWADTSGRATRQVAPALVDGAQRPASLVPGVNVAGYLSGVMGTGEHARQLAGALRTQQIPVSTTVLHPEAAPEDDALADTASSAAPGGAGPRFNLLCANADAVPGVAARLDERFFDDRYTIGFWAWEVSAFPDRFRRAFGYLDEVWVGSRHVRDAVAKSATIPVLAIPQPVSLSPDAARAAPPPDLPEGFRFLFTFDYLSVAERKNPLAVIDAFARAFAPGAGATLILKTLNDGHDPAAAGRVRAAAQVHPDIALIERRLPVGERDGLMNAADCYVSLHRAEGFGYTLAEAMWLGKPVIATAYSGNLDFMTPANSYLVSNELVPIGPGQDPYPADGVWAQADVDHAAALMRDVFEYREEASRRGRRAAREIRSSHGPEVAGRAMRERLELVMAGPAWIARGTQPATGSGHTSAAGQRLRSGPIPPVRPRFGRPQRAARKGLLRLLKPLTVHQRLVDDELIKAIEAVDANVQSLADSQAATVQLVEQLRAELLALQERLLRNGRS